MIYKCEGYMTKTEYDEIISEAENSKGKIFVVKDEKSAPELFKGYGEVVDVPVKILDLKAWRDEWLEENDPMDGSDCVTPFDKYLY